MIKFILILFISLFLVIALGISGSLFKIWPTSFNDHQILLTDEKKLAIKALILERKFVSNSKELYFGAPSEAIRLQSEKYVNGVIKKVVFEKTSSLKKSEIMSELKLALPLMENFDSEEKDQSLVYFGRMLDILQIKDTGELFNVWRYGFPYGWFMNA